MCKGCATLISTLSGEVENACVVFSTGDKVSLVEAFVAPTPLWCRTSPNADVLPLGRNCGKQTPASTSRLSTSVISFLYLALLLVLLVPAVCFTPCICCTCFPVAKGGISGPPSRDSGLDLSAVHPSRFILHKRTTFHTC